MWKAIYESVQGTSHQSGDLPCQDACIVVESAAPQPVLAAICCDGAGSAAQSHVGSQTVCRAFEQTFANGAPPELFDILTAADALRALCVSLRNELEVLAIQQEVGIREFACTLLAAVITETYGVFVQIGDGAIVVLGQDGYETVFWPQSGEYLNTTFFLTDANYADKMESHIIERRIEEFALFTDGLERLALSMNDRKVYQPFFRPMFQSLRGAKNPADFQQPLRNFLSSGRVNERTDDDKTLVLITRRPPEPA